MFRPEAEPASIAAGAPYRITDTELATRLSFFFWSSLPDEPLMRAAGDGRLKTPDARAAQVRRMLADRRASAFVSNFAGQWLHLRNLKGKVPNSEQFPDFDDNLRQAFQRETELFFESVIREDRSVLDLMTADYTFVNERLARHYGIPNVFGSDFRRVPLADESRRGILGKGAVLLVTSHPTTTSPVLRGSGCSRISSACRHRRRLPISIQRSRPIRRAPRRRRCVSRWSGIARTRSARIVIR